MSDTTFDQSFAPQGIEQERYAQWEAEGYFAPQGNSDPYCIAIPPPNITGSLHMGHAFQHTIMDTLIRYQRMRGRSTLWQTGTDHAGIATQMLVERSLESEGTSKEDIGRDAFIDRVWQWRDESGGTICKQLRRVGSSVDWSRERFTMDEGFSRAVREVFVRLHDEGLIYRGQRLVNWDPVLQSAISDLEVESTQEKGHLWHFRYPLLDAKTADGKDYLVVATTRPETMLGDTAVAVHPDDERYQSLIGKTVRLPLANREIPVIADSYVDPEFGSGCVKITPAHDFNDYEMGQRHDLPMINIMAPDASLNAEVPDAYQGMDRYDARKQIVTDLDAAGLLEKIEDHNLAVPRGDRSDAVVEPYLTYQWFVKIQPLAEPAIAAVENGDIEFVPKQYENLYFAWMREVRDWCISRQQWWGHSIPAWYDDDGNAYVGHDEEAVRSKYNLGDMPLRADEDVLETWFSSALWTFGTLGWPEQTRELELYHPTDVLVTGFDIIFFWVARMIMMTLKFTGEIPFKKVYVTGLICDAEGQKMSKSKGNGLDPLDIIDGVSLDELVEKRTNNLMQPQLAKKIEKRTRKEYPEGIPAYGTDALRFTFCALASTNRVINFDLSRVEGYRNFCNKLWNASKFVMGNIEGHSIQGAREDTLPDRWIRSRFARMLEDYHFALETYRFDLLANHIYEFVWHEYCDWYLELTKPILWDESASEAQHRNVRATLIEILEMTLRVAHPVMPFITEELWQKVARVSGQHPETDSENRSAASASIMMQPFPELPDTALDEAAEADIEWLKKLITALRNIRGELNIPMSKPVPLLVQQCSVEDLRRLEDTRGMIDKLVKVESLQVLDNDTTAPAAAMQLVGSMQVYVPLAGLIDLDAERDRLRKAIDKKQQERKRIEGKLANEKFVANAPAEVVDKEKAKAADAQQAQEALEQQLAQLG